MKGKRMNTTKTLFTDADLIASFLPNKIARASLLANKATLERHRPKEHCKNPNCAGPICLECGSKETAQIAFPCPSFLDVTNQLDEVMG
jgi:hypothetical protein